jgi:hypothetical protein
MGAAWREAIPEVKLAHYALKLGPVKGLCADMEPGADAAAIAVKELISGHTFLRAGIDPVSWIGLQIAELQLPLHPCVPELISDFIMCCCISVSPFTFSPVELDEVYRLSESDSLVCRLVVAYLVLSHNSQVKQLGSKCLTTVYPPEVIERLNLKPLLRDVEGLEFGVLLPERLMVICMSEYPEVMAEPMWYVVREEPLVASWLLTEDDQSQGEWKVSPLHARLIQLSRKSDKELSHHLEEVCGGEILTQLVKDECSEAEARVVFAAVWRKLFSSSPISCSVATMEVMKNERVVKSISSAKMIKDPLMVLRVKESVFKCVYLFGILLEILEAYSSSSRKRLFFAISAALPGPDKEGMEQLAVVQDCAIAQLVIEVLAHANNAEIEALCCRFLHQMFIQHPNVLQPLHNQGFPRKCIGLMVDQVPSCHIWINSLFPNLLLVKQEAKRAFTIELASHLCAKYPTPQALDIARSLLHHLLEEAKTTPLQTLSFVKVTSASLKRIIEAFPVLLDEFVELCECFPKDQTFWNDVVPTFDIQPVISKIK